MFALCLVLWTTTCQCLIALFKRASAHILRALYSADIAIMNFGSSLDSVACCLMLVAGRPISQQNFQLSATAQPDATCNNFTPNPTHNASHTQAWSPSPVSACNSSKLRFPTGPWPWLSGRQILSQRSKVLQGSKRRLSQASPAWLSYEQLATLLWCYTAAGTHAADVCTHSLAQ